MSLTERFTEPLVQESETQKHEIPPDARAIISKTRSLSRPDMWSRIKIQEDMPLEDRVNQYILDLTLRVAPAIHGLVRVKWGREGKGETVGREGEDTTIGLDEVAETFAAEKTLQYAMKYGLNVAVLSEHSDSLTWGPNAVDVRDPIDNSGEYQAGHGSINQYFAGGVFIKENDKWEPKSAYSCNAQTEELFYSFGGKNYEYNPNTGEVINLGVPGKVESVRDPNFKLASYVGKDKYIRPFWNNYNLLNKYRNQSEALHTVAGSHQYGDGVATGATSAYIMFGEPIGELAEGLAFAKAAEYVVASVDPETGEWEEYEFDVDYYLKHPDEYREDRVPMLIVASTKKLLRELIHIGFTKNLPLRDFKMASPLNNFSASEGEGEEMTESKIITFPGQQTFNFDALAA